jgi:hypothetical protein
MAHSFPGEESRETLGGVVSMLLFGLPAFVLNLLLLVFAQWKETQVFWRSAGGYPVWLRHVVYFTFYPLLVIELGLLGLVTVLSLRHALAGRPGTRPGLLGVAVLWALFGLVVTVLVWNNVRNLFDGHALHWKPD